MIESFNSKQVMMNRDILEKMLKYSYEAGSDISLPLSFYDEKILGLCKYLDEGKAFYFVAKDEDNIAGFLWACELNKNSRRMIHILYIAVLEEYQKKGYGNQLIEKVENLARELGIDILELNVRATNPAILFYKKHSFCEEHITMTKSLV